MPYFLATQEIADLLAFAKQTLQALLP